MQDILQFLIRRRVAACLAPVSSNFPLEYYRKHGHPTKNPPATSSSPARKNISIVHRMVFGREKRRRGRGGRRQEILPRQRAKGGRSLASSKAKHSSDCSGGFCLN